MSELNSQCYSRPWSAKIGKPAESGPSNDRGEEIDRGDDDK